MARNESVPYFVLRLQDGRAKAVFTVPGELVHMLTAHPILCRGAAFELQLDQHSNPRVLSTSGAQQRRAPPPPPPPSRAAAPDIKTSFLSTEYYSPDPEETAADISQRLAIRMDNADSFQVFSGMLGL